MEVFSGMRSDYGNDSIDQLVGAERIRKLPATMLGSKGLRGAQHTVYEILGNVSDENISGYGDKVDITLYEDGSISIRDYGRGVPLGWNHKRKAWNYYLVYEELYAGGKYGKQQDILKGFEERGDWDKFNILDYPYIITVGMNGVGAAATQCSSEYCTVSSIKDGLKATMEFRDGKSIWEELKVEETDEETGTFVHWKPDARVFSDVNITGKWLDSLCRSSAYIMEMTVTFNNKGKISVYEKSTIEEKMTKEVGYCAYARNFTHGVDSEGDVVICYSDVAVGPGGFGSSFFNNKIEVNGGSHSSAVFSAEARFFEERGAEEGVKIKPADYSGLLSFIISTLTNKMSPRGQTKDSVDDFHIYQCAEENLYNILKTEWAKKTSWLVDVVGKAAQNARNREAVQRLSKNIREVEKVTRSTNKASNKFIPCDYYLDKKYEQVEYLIMEGDSAGNTVKGARDSRFQAIMKIRGKSLNVFKASIDKIIANAEIRDMIASLGCGVDLGIDDVETFDIKKLKAGKIFFVPDADIDGKHIAALLFLIFWRLFPELLYQGYVYLINAPLYVIHLKNDEFVFCRDEEDLATKKNEIGEYQIKEITRFKGLGEMEKDQLWSEILDPANRSVTQLKIDRDDTDIVDTLEVFFGKNTSRRKQAILGSMMGEEYNDITKSIEDIIADIDENVDSGIEYEDIVM